MTKKIKLKINARLLKKRFRKQGMGGKKHCRFCGNAEQEAFLDFKNSGFLKSFLTERGKILPARISGNCSLHQRVLSRDIRKARVMSLLPYATGHM
jgi:small subunit ribosomal protein S18